MDCGDNAGVAVLAVLGVIAIWRLAVKGKGAVAARLAAWLCAVIVVWVMVGFKDPAVAGTMATDFVSGISAAASGLAAFLGHF